MIGMTVKIEDKTKRVADANDRAAFKNLGHASATIRKDAAESIEVSPDPSPAGSPPHTRRRQLKGAIRYAQDKKQQEAVIGPEFSKVGESGAAHELGEEFKGQDFDERPYMFPALEDNLDRFTSEWAGSIGE